MLQNESYFDLEVCNDDVGENAVNLKYPQLWPDMIQPLSTADPSMSMHVSKKVKYLKVCYFPYVDQQMMPVQRKKREKWKTPGISIIPRCDIHDIPSHKRKLSTRKQTTQ